MSPQRLDAAGIYSRIPHAGRMRLLDEVLDWDERTILCTATSHGAESNPLRRHGGLAGVHALEYAAQAMAVHGNLAAGRGGAETVERASAPATVYVAAFQEVTFGPGGFADCASDRLEIAATLEAAMAGVWRYGFTVHAGTARIADGRAVVMIKGAQL